MSRRVDCGCSACCRGRMRANASAFPRQQTGRAVDGRRSAGRSSSASRCADPRATAAMHRALNCEASTVAGGLGCCAGSAPRCPAAAVWTAGSSRVRFGAMASSLVTASERRCIAGASPLASATRALRTMSATVSSAGGIYVGQGPPRLALLALPRTRTVDQAVVDLPMVDLARRPSVAGRARDDMERVVRRADTDGDRRPSLVRDLVGRARQGRRWRRER